jgi:hypothetical protein
LSKKQQHSNLAGEQPSRHLIVENCEDGLTEQQVDELIAIVARHLGVVLQAAGAAASGDDTMQE